MLISIGAHKNEIMQLLLFVSSAYILSTCDT